MKLNRKIVISVILIILICFSIFIILSQNSNQEEIITMTNADLAYSKNREDYSSDEQFTNFRKVTVGNIKPNIYRGASPIDDTNNRVDIVNTLLEKNHINYVINLTNSEKEFKSMLKSDNYIYTLYKENKIYFGDLGTDYESQEYAFKMANALMQITKNEGPFYIHCLHGRDRTGMACIILEALTDATFQEIKDDYMKTYENYNFTNANMNPDMYNKILKSRFKNAIYYITREEKIANYTTYNYKQAAIDYLKFGGLTDTEINELIKSITQ